MNLKDTVNSTSYIHVNSNDNESIIINFIAVIIGYIIIANIVFQMIFGTIYAITYLIMYSIYYTTKLSTKFMWFIIKGTFTIMSDIIGILFNQIEKFVKNIFCMNDPYQTESDNELNSNSEKENNTSSADDEKDADESESDFDNTRSHTQNIIIIDTTSNVVHKYNGICDTAFLAFYSKNKDAYKRLHPDMNLKDVKNALYRRWKSSIRN